MKTDRYKPMTDRQARQLEKLGIKYDRSWTIHYAARVVSQALQPTGTRRAARTEGGT